MALQDTVRSLRDAKGWSVRDLAEASGVSVPYIHQIENGMKRNPSGAILQKLASGLGATVADLLGAETAIPQTALKGASASLRLFARKRSKSLGLRQEDLAMLRGVHYRGRRPRKVEDWELIFLFLRRILE